MVHDTGLKELLSFLVPNYRPPSTTHVSALIRKDYLDGKSVIVAQIQGNMIALTTDIWTSRATQAFATTTAHFINKCGILPLACLRPNIFLGIIQEFLFQRKYKKHWSITMLMQGRFQQ